MLADIWGWVWRRFLEYLAVMAACVLLFFIWAVVYTALAADYGSPDLGAYYRSLMQPDNPASSCCGEADAYYADQVAECGPSDGENCALVAIITDTRDNAIRGRRPVEVGTRIPVPVSKIRKKPIPNPTDHNIIFLSSTDRAYCWEPQAGL